MESYKNDIFEALKSKCFDFVNSKYILSQIRIKAILEWIVINPSLYDFVKKCSNGIDFRNEFNRMINNSRGYLVLPSGNRYKITIVIGLLYDLDNGDVSLTNVLKNYFPKNSMEESFDLFSECLIFPFIDAVSKLYLSDTDPAEDDGIEEEKKTENKRYDFAYINKMINPLIMELNTLIQGDNSIDDNVRSDFTAIAEGLIHAFSIADLIMIKACFAGLKHSLGDNRKYRTGLQKLENYLKKFYLII